MVVNDDGLSGDIQSQSIALDTQFEDGRGEASAMLRALTDAAVGDDIQPLMDRVREARARGVLSVASFTAKVRPRRSRKKKKGVCGVVVTRKHAILSRIAVGVVALRADDHVFWCKISFSMFLFLFGFAACGSGARAGGGRCRLSRARGGDGAVGRGRWREPCGGSRGHSRGMDGGLTEPWVVGSLSGGIEIEEEIGGSKKGFCWSRFADQSDIDSSNYFVVVHPMVVDAGEVGTDLGPVQGLLRRAWDGWRRPRPRL